MNQTSTVTIKSISAEEAHFDKTDAILEKVKDLEDGQQTINKNIGYLDNSLFEIITYFMILAIIMIITIIVVSCIINSLKKKIEYQNTIIQNIINKEEKPEITYTEKEIEILEAIKANPEKADALMELLK